MNCQLNQNKGEKMNCQNINLNEGEKMISQNVGKWTVKQVAEYYNVTENFIYSLARKNEIPCQRLSNKCYRFDINEVNEYFNKQSTNLSKEEIEERANRISLGLKH